MTTWMDAVMGVATVVSAAGSVAAGSAQGRAAGQNARLARLESEEGARRTRRDTDALQGRQRALVTGQGTTFSGTPLLIFEDTRRESEIEISHILAGGTSRAQAFREQGSAARIGSYVDAGTTILGGINEALRT